jgi:hypothetical protein
MNIDRSRLSRPFLGVRHGEAEGGGRVTLPDMKA